MKIRPGISTGRDVNPRKSLLINTFLVFGYSEIGTMALNGEPLQLLRMRTSSKVCQTNAKNLSVIQRNTRSLDSTNLAEDGATLRVYPSERIVSFNAAGRFSGQRESSWSFSDYMNRLYLPGGIDRLSLKTSSTGIRALIHGGVCEST